ncbi:MAG: SMI1/KNR4 family protein [Bacteroidota bacterium]
MKTQALGLLKIHSIDNLGTGTSEDELLKLEEKLNIVIPNEYRIFLKEIGYAEIYGDEIYSVYGSEDIPYLGIYYQNKENKDIEKGLLKFFSNDLDGQFYINLKNGEIFLNSIENLFAKSFNEFLTKMLNE